tara:strand:+ start:56 stop:445 length:390 start_codon:yes stop_codon:yes gene_type:complete
MKTQYILRLGKLARSVITETPEQLYWNTGLQKMDDNINLVSLYNMFRGTNTKTEDDMSKEAFEVNAHTIELTEFNHFTMTDFQQMLVEDVEKELKEFEIYADYHKMAETNLDRYYHERGKLIKVLDFVA